MIVCNNGSISLNQGVVLQGKALTTNGAITTAQASITIPSGCASIPVGISTVSDENKDDAEFYPNPFKDRLTVALKAGEASVASELKMYDVLGTCVLSQTLDSATTVINLNLPTGIYFYKIFMGSTIHSGKLVSE